MKTNDSTSEVESLGTQRERKHVAGLVLPFLARDLLYLLTSAEWMLWTVIFLHSDRKGRCFLLNSTLAGETGLSIGTVQQAKRGLVSKGWLMRCGQKAGRGSNIYEIAIQIPKQLDDFIDALWERMNKESWWGVYSDRVSHSLQHLDWMVAWRTIRTIRECEASMGACGAKWIPSMKSKPVLYTAAMEAMTERLSMAGCKLRAGRSLWWLFGDGFEGVS
jgi:helix-turn-helix protein